MVVVRSVLVSKRPALVDEAASRAAEWSEVSVLMDSGSFLDALRSGFDSTAIKVDDDDVYASDHHRIMRHYDGRVLFNVVKRYGCDGQFLGWRETLSGGVVPGGLFESAVLNDAGMVEPWVRTQPHHSVWAGTVAYVCPGRWLWRRRPLWLNTIECDHQL